MRASRDWFETLAGVEALQDVELDRALVRELESAARASMPADPAIVRFHIPSFKRYASTEIGGCGKNSWPAVSVTGAVCRLQCDHCRAKILEPMIAAQTPERLWQIAAAQIAAGARGMLLTGGSNLRDEVEYERFYPCIRRIKDNFPRFRIAMHTALVTRDSARCMEQAGIDVAMLDVIGAQDTVTQVYHLKRPVSDFEQSLYWLTRTSLRVVPHIVVGLHYGRLLGEWNALEMIARHRPQALVLVVVMPVHASKARPFASPDPRAVGSFMLDARRLLPDLPLSLGCARPAGRAKMQIDAYAVMAGVGAVAHPAEGIVELALRLGREARISTSCCSTPPELAGEAGGDEDMRIDLAALQARSGAARPGRALRDIPVVSA